MNPRVLLKGLMLLLSLALFGYFFQEQRSWQQHQ